MEAALPPQLGEALEADGVGLLEGAEQLLTVRLQPRHRAHPAAAPRTPPRACAAAPHRRHHPRGACAAFPRMRSPRCREVPLGRLREGVGPSVTGSSLRPPRGAAVPPAPRREGEPGRRAHRPTYPSVGRPPGRGRRAAREGGRRLGGRERPAGSAGQPPPYRSPGGCRWGFGVPSPCPYRSPPLRPSELAGSQPGRPGNGGVF